MTKEWLVSFVAERARISEQRAELAYDAFWEAILSELKAGQFSLPYVTGKITLREKPGSDRIETPKVSKAVEKTAPKKATPAPKAAEKKKAPAKPVKAEKKSAAKSAAKKPAAKKPAPKKAAPKPAPKKAAKPVKKAKPAKGKKR